MKRGETDDGGWSKRKSLTDADCTYGENGGECRERKSGGEKEA